MTIRERDTDLDQQAISSGAAPPSGAVPPGGEGSDRYVGGASEPAPRRIWGAGGRFDRHGRTAAPPERDLPVTTIATQAIARALLPISVMIALAELVKGYADTGDGFSAGVILGLAAIIQVAAFGISVIDREPLLRYAPFGAFIGILLALVIAFTPLISGHPVMTHRPLPHHSVLHLGALELITAVGFDVSVCLLVFGFVVGTMTILGRTASIAGMQQQAAAERLHSGGPNQPLPSRDVSPDAYAGGPPDRHGAPAAPAASAFDRHGPPRSSRSAFDARYGDPVSPPGEVPSSRPAADAPRQGGVADRSGRPGVSGGPPPDRDGSRDGE